MPMITGATTGVTPKHGSITLKTGGKDGTIGYQKNNLFVSNIPPLASVDAKYDGKFDDVTYYNSTTGNY